MDKTQKQAVLDVLNSFEVQDSQGGEECYILVESSEENLAALEAVGIAREKALSYGEDGTFCIAALAMDMQIADTWDAEKGLIMYSEEGMLFPLQPNREGRWFFEYKFLEEVSERSAVAEEQAEAALIAACELLKKRQAPADLEGMGRKFTGVFKLEDVATHLQHAQKMQLRRITETIDSGRRAEGKSPASEKTYLVINTDEPYADEVIAILKRHGHWG